jgi:hypothetical protein
MNKRQFIRITDPKLIFTGSRTTPIVMPITRQEVAKWLRDNRHFAKRAAPIISLARYRDGYVHNISKTYDMVIPV